MKKILEAGDKIQLNDREYLQTLLFLSERLKITQLRIDNLKITISAEIFSAHGAGTEELRIFQTAELKFTPNLKDQLRTLLEGFGYTLPHQTQDATPGFPSDSEEKEQEE